MSDYNFNADIAAKNCIEWIQNWFEENGPDCNAIVGISGGKDSSIVAGLCAKALGKERVIGVLLPMFRNIDTNSIIKKHLHGIPAIGSEDILNDIDVAKAELENVSAFFDGLKLCNLLGIKYFCRNITSAVNSCICCLNFLEFSESTRINLPARIRMSLLYATAQTYEGRVANTCNLSEDWVGYSTRYGDSAGDFSPLANFTVSEVKRIGYAIGLPASLIERTPSDGLCGKSDEENLGFTYADLDKYIRTGKIENPFTKAEIDARHDLNIFKMLPMPSCPSGIEIKAKKSVKETGKE